MPARYPLPSVWMLTDERQGDGLWPALRALPPGSGVILRHYSLAEAERRRLFRRIHVIVRRRRLVLLLSADAATAQRWGADGVYRSAEGRALQNERRCTPAEAGVQVHRCSWTPAFAGVRRTFPARLLWAATAHNRRELRRAEQRGADLVLLSPLFPTRSHPGAKTLGPGAFARLAKMTRLPIIALGGVGIKHMPLLRRIGAYGWAGIDAFTKAKAKRIRT